MPTAAELTKLWAGAREAGLPEDQLRDLVEQVSGQRSLRAMSREQTSRAIDALVALGARPGNQGAKRKKPRGRPAQDGVTKLITGPQQAEIQRLRELLGGDWLSEPYFAGACKRRLGGKERPATAGDASRMIEALKQRVAHARRSAPRSR